jgi:hypothetical protein
MLQESSGDGNNDGDNSKDPVEKKLCEQCAKVMKQQQLSPSSFLARFFDVTMLSQHAADVLQKSGKGSAPILAERIAGEWAKNKGFPVVSATMTQADQQEQGMATTKTESSKITTVVTKKITKTASTKRKGSNKDFVADHSEQEANNELAVPSKHTPSTTATAAIPKKAKTTKKVDGDCDSNVE